MTGGKGYRLGVMLKGMKNIIPEQDHGSGSRLGCVAKFFVIRDNAHLLKIEKTMISFKGVHFPKDVILYAVFFYVRYGVSYRDL